MNCACGASVVPTPEGAPCGSCDRRNIECASCGGGFSVSPDTKVTACPYCDTPMHDKEAGGGPPFFPVNTNREEAQEQLLRFLLNRFGIPDDFERRHRVTSLEQVFVPLHLFTVTAKTSDSIVETDTTAVVCAKRLWYHRAIADYRFAARVKQFMDPDRVRARIYDNVLGPERAAAQAQTFGEELLGRDKKRFSEVSSSKHVSKVDQGLVYYPLYEITYYYGASAYRGVVDASNGAVCLSEHPMCTTSRAAVMTAGAATLVFTLVVAALFVAASRAHPICLGSAVLVWITGMFSGLRIVWTGLRSHSSKAEVHEERTKLQLDSLTATMPVSARQVSAGGKAGDLLP